MQKISVLMPAYNCEAYIEEAIDSILNQTYKNFELIIVNDGSTDNTENIIKSKNDNRIVLHNNEKNMGLPYTRNKLLSLADGEFIAFMDSDDISMKDRFEKQVDYLNKNKHISVVGANCIRFNEKKKSYSNYPTDSEDIKIKLMFTNCIANPAVMMRRELLTKNNIQYNSEFFVAQDYEFYVRCSMYGNITNLSNFLLRYRTGHSNITKKTQTEKQLQRRKLLHKLHLYALEGNGFKLTKSENENLERVLDDTIWDFTEAELMVFKNTLISLIEQNKENNKFSEEKFKKALYDVYGDRVCKGALNRKTKTKLLFDKDLRKIGLNTLKYFVKSMT